MSKLHSQDYRIVLKQGLYANIGLTSTKNLAEVGEPAYTTDTKQLFIFDGTDFIPVVRAKSDVPSSASDTGIAGEIAYDSDYIYVCVATDTWKRVGIATW